MSSGAPDPDSGPPDASAIEGGACPRHAPDCPDEGGPSYHNEIDDIIQAKCVACHDPGNTFSTTVLSTYSDLRMNKGNTLDQVYACTMPLADAAPLTPTERTDLLTWLACGAPDN